MKKNILIISHISDFQLAIRKINKSFLVLPTTLSTQAFCIKNNIEYINPLNIFTNENYKDCILKTDKIIKKLKYDNIHYDSLIKEIDSFVRFRIYYFFFIKLIVSKIKEEYIDVKIIVSGIHKESLTPNFNDNILSNTVKYLVDNKNIQFLSDHKILSKNNYFEYKIQNNFSRYSKKVLFNNAGYNFKRIISFFIKKRYQIIILNNENISFFKYLIFKLFNIKFLIFNETQIIKKKKNYIYFNELSSDEKLIVDFFNDFCDNLNIYITNMLNKINALDIFLKTNLDIKIIFSNIYKGFDGSLGQLSFKYKIPSAIISHGTLTKSFNEYDKIYKDIISHQVYSNTFSYILSQSNISNSFFEQKKISKKIHYFGNILFSNNKKKKNLNKNITILYAVTQKNQFNLQYFGCEMYYEFIDNLNFLSNLVKKYKYKFIIKLHPSEIENFKILKNIFKNLIFSNSKVEKLLDKVDIVTTFSSTILEDSINSNIPVILLDRWKRYKHCEAEDSPSKNNSAIYYITNEDDYTKCINTIKNSKDIDFKKYINSTDYYENIKKFLNKTLII